jgi:hypothetical protein
MDVLAKMTGSGVSQIGIADVSPNADQRLKQAYGNQAKMNPPHTANETLIVINCLKSFNLIWCQCSFI